VEAAETSICLVVRSVVLSGRWAGQLRLLCLQRAAGGFLDKIAPWYPAAVDQLRAAAEEFTAEAVVQETQPSCHSGDQPTERAAVSACDIACVTADSSAASRTAIPTVSQRAFHFSTRRRHNAFSTQEPGRTGRG